MRFSKRNKILISKYRIDLNYELTSFLTKNNFYLKFNTLLNLIKMHLYFSLFFYFIFGYLCELTELNTWFFFFKYILIALLFEFIYFIFSIIYICFSVLIKIIKNENKY